MDAVDVSSGVCTSVSLSSGDYVFCDECLSWTDAATACSDRGLSLVTIDSSTENEVLRTTASTYMSDTCGSSSSFMVHIGLHKSSGVTQWHSGSSVGYTNIQDSDDGPNASWRMYVSGGTGSSGRWYDNSKSAEFVYVCD